MLVSAKILLSMICVFLETRKGILHVKFQVFSILVEILTCWGEGGRLWGGGGGGGGGVSLPPPPPPPPINLTFIKKPMKYENLF